MILCHGFVGALLNLVGGLAIGEPLYDGDAYVTILSVPNFRVQGALTIIRKDVMDTDPVTEINGNEILTLSEDTVVADIDITVAP